MAVEIKQVIDKADLRKFVKFNIDLYKDNPYHVPGLINDEMQTLDKDANPAFEFCESVYFLAYKNNTLVGRIAGIINHKSNETWNQNHARFGFVDFINDDEVVDALFGAVRDWALSKGMDMLHGPMGFTDMDHEGMLVEGFDQLGTMATIYNYAYYPKQLERIGFVKDQDWKEYKIYVPKEIPEKHIRISELVRQKYGLKTLKFKSRTEIMRYGRAIFETLNAAYANLYGFSELSSAQIDYYIRIYLPMVRLDFVTAIVREEDDKVVGFAITLPNLSKALKKAKGKLWPFGFMHLLRALKSPPKVVDLYLIGVLPEYQNKGVNALIFDDLIPIFRKNKVLYAESNPELETNMAVQMQWNYFERKHHKTRRAYIKCIDK
ncbi:MAG: GNAT family N-acetyltransferase [Porphyromonas sp.]|nr:GNAT family N-acetyltransferase [Porphyromonas sp.]